VSDRPQEQPATAPLMQSLVNTLLPAQHRLLARPAAGAGSAGRERTSRELSEAFAQVGRRRAAAFCARWPGGDVLAVWCLWGDTAAAVRLPAALLRPAGSLSRRCSPRRAQALLGNAAPGANGLFGGTASALDIPLLAAAGGRPIRINLQVGGPRRAGCLAADWC
jgi:hypothetical protein